LAVERILFPSRRPGRRPKETVTAAHRDSKNCIHGPALYRAHIPGWEKHNRLDGSAKRELSWMQSAGATRAGTDGKGDEAKMNQPVWWLVQLNRK